jgi:dihydroorotase
MSNTLIKNARIINEGQIFEGDVLVINGMLERIGGVIDPPFPMPEIDANGHYLMPGVIDDQVHFREPGLTAKGDLYTESRAAAAGGTTSYIEQPNTVPQALTVALLEEKFALAAQRSAVNYSFNMGTSNQNLEELKRVSRTNVAGIKIFMGSSTGNMLVDDHRTLERIFSEVDHQLITHCEDEATIQRNVEYYRHLTGNALTPAHHPLIRSEEACLLSSQFAVDLARKHGSRLHVYHLSTGIETGLFSADLPLEAKKITAEVCIHHLWFSDEDYAAKGNFIKWNPAVKTAADRDQLWKALLEGRIDVIATDHAPHTLEEKQRPYAEAPSGGPLVQHSLQAMFQMAAAGKLTLEQVVEKMCHNPAILFRIDRRGFLREGYFADMVLVNPDAPTEVNKQNLLYKCGWSPFEGHTFGASIAGTWVNGQQVYNGREVISGINGMRLAFNR